MAVDKSLISGNTTMLILRLLEGKDMYGYEMIETLQEKSQNVFQWQALFTRYFTLWKKKAMFLLTKIPSARKHENIIR